MNVVVIVTDSLRADHVGCYGSAVKTPNMDRLAAEGVRLTRAYSENLPTMPTRRGFWTGRYHFHEAGWVPFPETDHLLAERLWSAGYTSALITDVYHMHKPSYNCGRGFDTTVFVRGQEYDPWIIDPAVSVSVQDSPVLRLRSRDDPGSRWNRETTIANHEQYLRNKSALTEEIDYYTPRTVREAVRWLEHVTSRTRDRLFLWLDLFDPHEPWDPPAPYDHLYTDPDYTGPDLVDPVPGAVNGYMTPQEVENTRRLYAGEVTFVDAWIGVLLDKLQELGIDDNTLIMHTTDHGEPFGEHGFIRKAKPKCYQYLIRTPWIIRPPRFDRPGTELDAVVQSVDMAPTILDFLGLNGEDNIDDPSCGVSLVPLIRGDVERVRHMAHGGWFGREWYACDGEWSFMTGPANKPELYDLTADPGERRNLTGDEPERAARMELELRRFVACLR